jgi:hypothetical protein
VTEDRTNSADGGNVVGAFDTSLVEASCSARSAASRFGRLAAHFSVKSVFGRPRRLATRAAAAQFMATHYRRFSGQKICPALLPTVPNDYSLQLRALRRRLRLTQDGLARRIGAAGRAVIYQ